MATSHTQYSETYFFTATILNWNTILDDTAKEIIAKSLKFLVDNNRIVLLGFVLMPNHIHILWHIKEDFKREEVQRDFLKYTAQQIKFYLQKAWPEKLALFRVNAKDRKYQIWERNARNVTIDNHLIFEQKLNYIHENPIQMKWQLVVSPEEYYYSSANYYLNDIDKFDMMTNGFNS